MTLRRALVYFGGEALRNLLRSWKVSLLAVSTITVSLLVGGTFLLVAANLTQLVEEWRASARVVVYLAGEIEAAEAVDVRQTLAKAPWVTGVHQISRAEAAERFRTTFPSVADLVGVLGERSLPSSFEVLFDPELGAEADFDAWLAELRALPSVEMVDDDRDWVRQLTRAAAVLRLIGASLGLVLLTAAVFTIGSVIRLTAYLYRDEIAVMRLVGATEFFIRGPFYVEGLFQGLLGGLVALGALAGSWALLVPRVEGSLLGMTLATNFLSPLQQVLLLLLGAAAGLVGAVSSLGRETLQRA